MEKDIIDGDLVKMDHENNIEYIGRRDFQVKIRGHRIELNEITTVSNIQMSKEYNWLLKISMIIRIRCTERIFK